MTTVQVGLVDMTGALDADLLQAAAAALNVQVTRDLPQFWPMQASVVYLPNKGKVPAGVWPVQLVKSLPPGEGGFHTDPHNQPMAKVIGTPGDNSWTIDASHEIVEMLVDPYGNRMQVSTAIEISGGKVRDGTGQFSYLVEACDPCEANDYAYQIQGIAVSDFITPHYYDPMVTTGTRYSFTGAITAPRELLPGGYISFVDQETNEWQQILWVDTTKPPTISNLGPATGASLRAWVDRTMANSGLPIRGKTGKEPINHALMRECAAHRAKIDRVSAARGKRYA